MDLQLLVALTVSTDLGDTYRACLAVLRPALNTNGRHQSMPHSPAIYARALEGLNHLDLAQTVEAAAQRVQQFVNRIDAAPNGR